MIAKCIKGDNPVPGTDGWYITEGREYRVLRDAGDWLMIVADNGSPGNYKRERFEVSRHSEGG